VKSRNNSKNLIEQQNQSILKKQMGLLTGKSGEKSRMEENRLKPFNACY